MGGRLRDAREDAMSNNTDIFADLDRLRLPAQQTEGRADARLIREPSPAKPRHIKGEFLKGSIPLG